LVFYLFFIGKRSIVDGLGLAKLAESAEIEIQYAVVIYLSKQLH
jgi:hypothetical protein